MRGVRWLVVVLGGALVGLLVWVESSAPSPGPLAAVHARVPELAGKAGCARCHGGAQTMAQACAACHEEIAAQTAMREGLHGGIPAERAAGCGGCHGEHNGPDFPMAGPRAFAGIGVADVRAFEHAGLAFDLHGAHRALACEKCHAHAEVAVLPPGSKRFLGASDDCATCHRDPHGGRLPECETCHGQEEPFARAPGFVHDARFPLRGAHAGVECQRCHDESGARSVAGLLAGAGSAIEVRSCESCHATPHGVAFLERLAPSVGKQGALCSQCHAAEHGAFRWPAARMDAIAHAASGFPLTGPHAEVKCEQCHASLGMDAPPDVPRFPGRSADECQACHGDPHRGAFDAGAFAGSACVACHDRGAFAPAAFGAELHARTRFPLTGAHLAVGCERCHQDAAATHDFRGAKTACAECHADVHAFALSRRPPPQVMEGFRDCARCHTTASFADAGEASFDHEAWTGFALRGAHRTAKCEACHAPQRTTKASPRAFGIAPRACASCHADPHAGQLATASGTDCARCHRDDASFHAIAFDHETQSRFHPGAVHAAVACSACHREYPRPGGGSIVRYKPLRTDCTDCHGSFTPVHDKGATRRGGGG